MNIIYIEKIILIKYRKDLDSGMYEVFEKKFFFLKKTKI